MNKTFKDYYLAEGKKPTPRQAFIAEIARITKKSETTVKQWVNGIQTPDALTRHVIANRLKCDPETLFPTINKNSQQS